ncbi:NACHT domain-containing protein [Haloechinothrix halophila]|uniref:NACHT domain-containing protein n=1 Tax=Haloechinothrix halophila TaxID=1069073 RepID=UPI0003F93337|nr:NACHT domain-containing protein [Haloechinothrix halophila]
MDLHVQALKVGSEVVKHVVHRWFDLRRAEHARNAELTDLLELSISDIRTRRKLARQLEDIVDQVADKLEPLYEQEFREVPENERAAALAAVVEVLQVTDLSDKALFAADADARKLAIAIRARIPRTSSTTLLSVGAQSLYDRVLDQCCVAVVHIVGQLPEFTPRATAEQLQRLARLSDDVSEVLRRLPRTSLTAPDGTERDAEFRDRYLNAVSNRLDHLHLLGVDHQHNPRTRVSVGYLSLTVTSDAGYDRRALDERWFTDRGGQRERGGLRAEDALAAHPRTLLLGEAGSGKTTLLQWLGVHSARGSFTGPLIEWNGRVPFLIRLREHAEGALPRPEHFVHGVADMDADLMPKGWVHRELADRALMLVDGVDELAPARRRKVRSWLEDLVSRYPELPIVVTSRPAAARKTWLADLGFNPVLLERMGPSEVTEFIHRWHDAIREAAHANPAAVPCDPDDLDGYESAMLRHLDSGPHLRRLATTPLLCALLCAVNLNRRQQLPQDRMALYETAVTMLVDRRDTERGVPHALELPLKDKLAVLRDLAWWLTRNGRVEASRAEAVERCRRTLEQLGAGVEPQEAIAFLIERSGIIQAPAEDRVDFVHRSFQEYLAAREAIDEQDIGVLVAHAHLDQWRETIVMAAGHASRKECADLLTGILNRTTPDRTPSRHTRSLRLLAVACRETAEKVDRAVSERIDDGLDAVLPPRSSRETRSLARCGAGVLRKLPTSLDDLTAAQAAACVQTAAFVNGQQALRLLTGYARDPRPEVQCALADAWRYFDPETYANEVLADAPLDGGAITVRQSRHVRFTQDLQHLSELDIDLDDQPADLSFLDEARHLVHLRCATVRPVDLTPVTQHEELRELWVWGEGVQPVLGELSGLGLETMGLQLSSGQGSLDPIAEVGTLEWLALRGVGSVDLTPIQRLNLLKSLVLHDSTTDPTPVVTSLPALEIVVLRAPLFDGLAGLRPVLPQLRQLVLTDVEIDLAELSIAQRLKMLSLLWCHVRDISVLASLLSLRRVSLKGTPVTDLRPLSNLPRLESLSLSEGPDGLDLTPLAQLPRTARIHLPHGADVSGLDAVRRRGHIVKQL